MVATINQIAEAAGVSTATVDRVLNNRPGVNPATVERVRAVMQALGAASPVRGRPRSTPNYRFGFVLPATRRGFFDMIDRVIAQAAGDFRHQHITEITHRLPNQDGADFAAGAGEDDRPGRHCPAGAGRAAGQAGHQRAGAQRRARGHAVFRCRRLAARDLRRRRQPRRRPHRGHAAGPRPAARRARPLRHAVAGHALRRRDRPAHRLRPGAGRALSRMPG